MLENINPSQLRALSEVCNHLLTKHCKLDIGTRKRLRKKSDTLKRDVIRGRNQGRIEVLKKGDVLVTFGEYLQLLRNRNFSFYPLTICKEA